MWLSQGCLQVSGERSQAHTTLCTPSILVPQGDRGKNIEGFLPGPQVWDSTLYTRPLWHHFLWGPLGKAVNARVIPGSLEERGEREMTVGHTVSESRPTSFLL